MEKLQMKLAKKKFELRMSVLAEYETTLERLLAQEQASVFAREALGHIAALAKGDEADEGPSEQLVALNDDFPTILRGSLFVYAVSAFENQARRYLNERIGKSVVSKGANLKQIADVLVKEMPTAIDDPARDRFVQYKHLRDACAHTNGEISSVLHELFKVASAATKIPGVIYKPFAEQNDESRETFTKTQMVIGTMELSREFIPNALEFFNAQFTRLST